MKFFIIIIITLFDCELMLFLYFGAQQRSKII